MSTTRSVEFFFDFGSPTSYLAWTQLPGICATAEAQLVYRPMLLVNPHFPINTLLLMRAVVGVQVAMPERLADFIATVYRAMWVEALNMGDPAVAAEVLERGGFDARAVLALASDPAVKEVLKANTEEAVRRGAFGAPTMFVGDQMFFGQDRLDFVAAALKAS